MNRTVIEGLIKIVNDAGTREQVYEHDQWLARAKQFLLTAVSPEEATRFGKLQGPQWPETWAMQVGHLEGLIANAEVLGGNPGGKCAPTTESEIDPQALSSNARKVFIVHGHDEASKESSARFLEKLGLEPIILHEQASGGRTIIEKFETFSGDVAFAVVLLTPDDVGSTAAEGSDLKKRARQNVIMELGYFIGRLGRTRVCALHKGDVELPSDYQGVLYIEMDSAGAWKAKLAQELVQSRIAIELTGLLGS